jgi:hypothetical protein
MTAGKTCWRVATSLVAPIFIVTFQLSMAVVAAEAPSRADVNDAIEHVEAGLARVTDDDLEHEEAQEGLAKARDARERDDLEGALGEQSGDN